MAVIEKLVRMLQCERCGHEWMPRQWERVEEFPQTCPACRSAFWNKPRRVKA